MKLPECRSTAGSYGRALAIAKRLVDADASDRAARRTLALAHEKLSDVEAWSGRPRDGLRHAREALEQWQQLANGGDGTEGVRAVAISHIKRRRAT